MQQTATVKVKLSLSLEAKEKLRATHDAYDIALNHTSQVAFATGITKKTALHHQTYQEVRKKTGLGANLACSARMVVCEAYTREPSPKKAHRFREGGGVRYDERTLSFDFQTASATLNTLKKNQRVVASLVLSPYHLAYLDGSWSFATTATLVRRKGRYYLHFVAHREVRDATGGGVLGSDAGIVRVATTSTGKVFSGGPIKQIRRQNFFLRQKLQAGHKSRGKRRFLQRLAGREHRAVEWLLWNVANGLVKEALRTNCALIVLEDLKGILKRVTAAKKQRLILHGWPFASLAKKVKHVAARHGIQVVEIDPKYTSQQCRCGHVAKQNRVSQSVFRCKKCGYSHNADLVAAHNLVQRYVAGLGAAVNQPGMPARSLAGQSPSD